MEKMIELSDALSMHKNGMQTITEPVYCTGKMNECNILFESISEYFQTVLASCKMDSIRSFFLMEKQKEYLLAKKPKRKKNNLYEKQP